MKYLFLTLTIILLFSCNYTNTQEVECAEILDKERIVESDGDGGTNSYYLIYTDKGEFTIQDELFRSNFKSSEWYGLLKEGERYSFETGGYRSGFLSMYPNIHTKPTICD